MYMTVQGQILGVNTPEAPAHVRTLQTCSMAGSAIVAQERTYLVAAIAVRHQGIESIYLHSPVLAISPGRQQWQMHIESSSR